MNLNPTSQLGFHHCAGLPGLHASGTCQPKHLFCYKPGLKSEEACVQIVDSQEIDDPTRSFSTEADLNKDKKTFLRGPNRHCPSKDGSRRFFRDTRNKAYPSRTPHNHSKSWKSKCQREPLPPSLLFLPWHGGLRTTLEHTKSPRSWRGTQFLQTAKIQEKDSFLSMKALEWSMWNEKVCLPSWKACHTAQK